MTLTNEKFGRRPSVQRSYFALAAEHFQGSRPIPAPRGRDRLYVVVRFDLHAELAAHSSASYELKASWKCLSYVSAKQTAQHPASHPHRRLEDINSLLPASKLPDISFNARLRPPKQDVYY